MVAQKHKTSERRFEIMKYICKNRFTTMPILAKMYGVTVRTIKRDIDELGDIIPIVTQQGRFGGGVGVMEGYSWNKAYMGQEDINLLKEIYQILSIGETIKLDSERLLRLSRKISAYEKPRENC